MEKIFNCIISIMPCVLVVDWYLFLLKLSCHVRMSVIMSGKRRVTAHIIQIFLNQITSSTWEVSGWQISSTFRPQRWRDGNFDNNFRNLAQKTSLSFISCYASRIADYVYLQRGFRNYGRPQVETFFNLTGIIGS